MLVTPKLRLVRQLGSGGMGAVWLADHLGLNTQVVVKFVSDKLVWSSEAVARFAREASAASQVKSPHVVQMLDHGVMETGIPYIVMELLEGHDLADHLTPAGLPPREVVPIITQLARALTRAHERGIVHRDIKPSNVFLCEMGGGELFVKLLDFGVAKHEAATKPGEETRTGALIGSPFYMSPEQLVGDKSVDFRSDLWSLGVLAFEALTGARPFRGDTIGALTMQVHTEPLPRPSQKNPALPPAIDGWFLKACARDPAARFGGAKELAAALARALDEEAPRGIELERSNPPVDAIGLAETAEVSSGERRPSRSGGSSSREAVSAPPLNSATGAGLSSTGGIGKKDGARRPMVLVGVVGVLGVAAFLGGRTIRGRGDNDSAGPPPVASVNANVGARPVEIAVPDARVEPAVLPVPVPVPVSASALQTVAKPPASVALPGRKNHPPALGSAAPSASVGASPSASPVASSKSNPSAAASSTRQQGSDDDIR
jgi:serine/threonine protein kinase